MILLPVACGWRSFFARADASKRRLKSHPDAFFLCAALVAGLSTAAEAVPWVQYADAASDSICDVVNAANLELVVLEDTGELAGVTGTDVVFLDTFVDEDGFVFFLGAPAGFIEFAEDGDGFRTLWWFIALDDVANVNVFTGEPSSTGLRSIDFVDVPCDACPFWDEPAVCVDSDLDGIDNRFDVCPDTPPDELADLFGCSCSQLDGDRDGLDDCIDLCPDTPPGLVPGFDGCACEEIDGDFDGVNACFDLCPDTPLDELPDLDGCSCSQLDGDRDGVDDCLDLCPRTQSSATVDADGCVLEPTPGTGGTVINICGSFGAVILAMMVFGLIGLKLGVRGKEE